MKDFKFKISKAIAESYPQLRIGIVKGIGFTNSEVSSELEEITRKVEEKIRTQWTAETLAEHPHIKAWREVYKSFGVKPKEYRPTCEALLRRVLKGERTPNINTIVNCYLLAELEYFIPCGGYDTDKLDGDLYLRHSKGGEIFYPIGAKDREFTNPGEIIYSDNTRILTRKWNYRDSDLTKITVDTRDVLLMAEAPYMEITTESLQKFLERLTQLLNRFCDGSVESTLVCVLNDLEVKF